MGMLDNNNVLLFLKTLIPGLLYFFIIYLAAPIRSIKIKVAFLYFLMGILATVAVTTTHWVFPQWGDDVFTGNKYVSGFLWAFLQVALLEEGCKFLMFKTLDSYRYRKFHNHPFSIMAFAACVSMGFAILENLVYLQIYENSESLLLVRSVTSLVCHMLCGLFMGFFIALGHIKYSKTKSLIKKYSYYALGLLAAISFHGIYDYSLFLTGSNHIAAYVVISGIIIAYLMSRKLTRGNFESDKLGKISKK